MKIARGKSKRDSNSHIFLVDEERLIRFCDNYIRVDFEGPLVRVIFKGHLLPLFKQLYGDRIHIS